MTSPPGHSSRLGPARSVTAEFREGAADQVTVTVVLTYDIWCCNGTHELADAAAAVSALLNQDFANVGGGGAPPEPPAGGDQGLAPLAPPPSGVYRLTAALPITTGQVKLVNVLAAGAAITDRALLHEGISKLIGREVHSVKHLTKAEATTVIESLQTRQPKEAS